MHGWINLDKPLGMSSAQAVDKVKKILSALSHRERGGASRGEGPYPNPLPKGEGKLKIGHAGTLDPLASGVLVLAVGEATKLVNYAMDAPKEYIFTVTWGEERDTDDGEGVAVATSDKRPTLADIQAILPRFIGDIQQTPPAYSAIKMEGRRAYDMARAGEAPEMKARAVRVERFEVLGVRLRQEDALLAKTSNLKPETSTTFLCACGKGTYIRSLARDMGRVLGVYGYVSMLRRTGVGKFSEKGAISLDKLEELVHKGDLGFIEPPQMVLDDILAYHLNGDEALTLKRGQWLPKPTSLASEPLVACLLGESLVAICRTDERFIRPERVFNII